MGLSTRRNDTAQVGEKGEAEALRLLKERGYVGRNLNEERSNHPTYDLEIDTVSGKVRISVKSARARRDIALGVPRSFARLADDAFLMILMPVDKRQEIHFDRFGYHLLILPGGVAKSEALEMHYEYWRCDTAAAEKNTVRVKDEVNRPGSRSRAGEVFASWNRRFRDAWHLLPGPSLAAMAGLARETGPDEEALRFRHYLRQEPRITDNQDPAIGRSTTNRNVWKGDGMSERPADIVSSLNYLRNAGMSERQVCMLHHFDRQQNYRGLIKYFSGKKSLGSETNRRFAARLKHVAKSHREDGGGGFTNYIQEALQEWPQRS
jgi:hypothetical protein